MDYEHHLVFNIKPLSYYQTLKRSKYGNLYITPKGKEYRKFLKDCCMEYINNPDNHFKIYTEWIIMEIKVFNPTKRSHDVDNAAKSILDCFNNILYDDDKLIKRLILEKDYDKENPRVEIWIKKYE